jgi:hypothetical protein
VLYVGDFNLTTSSEACFQTLTAAGQGQGFDPPDRLGNWELNPAFVDVMTYSPTNLRYRDDFQIVTQNIMSDPAGLMYVTGSFHSFANNGSVALYGSLNSPANTALPGLPNRAAVLSGMTTASDHIPVVADYEIHFGPFWQPGDTNCDGSVNFTDINPFVLMLADPAGYAAAFPACDILIGDINGDGSTNFSDINPFVAVLTGG